METNDAAARIRATRERAAEVGDAVKGAVEGANLSDLLADLSTAAQETAAALADNVEEGEAVVRAKLDEAESTIRDHPLLAVGIAAGVGFMLGLMLSGSGRDNDVTEDDGD
jgi:ElaB/YqjD/DUF883 family membrane-anchored ribosome-binding protein